jgi:hypothetical protein
MKVIVATLVALSLLSGVCAEAPEAVGDEEIEIVADQLYWWEPEGNLGAGISAKFNSRKQMEETLSLTGKIGSFKSKQWVLGDILVSMDLNANGDVAYWTVSGPKPLVSEYLKELEAAYKDRSLFYDFGYSEINYKPTAYGGGC